MPSTKFVSYGRAKISTFSPGAYFLISKEGFPSEPVQLVRKSFNPFGVASIAYRTSDGKIHNFLCPSGFRFERVG